MTVTPIDQNLFTLDQEIISPPKDNKITLIFKNTTGIGVALDSVRLTHKDGSASRKIVHNQYLKPNESTEIKVELGSDKALEWKLFASLCANERKGSGSGGAGSTANLSLDLRTAKAFEITFNKYYKAIYGEKGGYFGSFACLGAHIKPVIQ